MKKSPEPHLARTIEAAESIGASFSPQLLQWYARRARDLPWRVDSDPYRVWVSEIMLQQTRVETVIPYYEKFLAAFPDIETLATADEQKLLSHWSGLGYYSRARNLQKGAQHILTEHDGCFPRDRDLALRVPGVGPYTSAAILSIAFGEAHPVVDGNVIRVLSRLFLIEPPLTNQVGRLELVADQLLDQTKPGDHNQAMMELGATVCLPKNPCCLVCPVSESCAAFSSARTDEFPRPRPKAKTTDVECALLWLRNGNGRYLFRMGWPLLPHLWMPPIITLSETASSSGSKRGKAPDPGDKIESWLGEEGLVWNGEVPDVTGTFRHSITTRKLRLQVVEADIDTTKWAAGITERGAPEEAWFDDGERVGLGRSSLVDKALRYRR